MVLCCFGINQPRLLNITFLTDCIYNFDQTVTNQLNAESEYNLPGNMLSYTKLHFFTAEYFHMEVICQRYSWINVHIYAISYLMRGDLFFICVTNLWWNTGKMSTFPHHFVFGGMVKNAARPGGQGLNLCLFLVKSDFLVGGSGVPWHFLCWGFLFIWPKDSAQSHQPTATKHAGLHHKRPGETGFFFPL